MALKPEVSLFLKNRLLINKKSNNLKLWENVKLVRYEVLNHIS